MYIYIYMICIYIYDMYIYMICIYIYVQVYLFVPTTNSEFVIVSYPALLAPAHLSIRSCSLTVIGLILFS